MEDGGMGMADASGRTGLAELGPMSSRSGAAASQKSLDRRRLVGFAVGGLALAVLAGAGGAAAVLASQPAPGTCDTVALSASVLPSVVTVFATGSASSGSGSGSIISADGLVLTNDHVIADAVGSGTIEVLLNDGDLLPATLVGTDPITDLALLRVDRTRLPVLALARQDVLVVGQLVVALGAPLGLSGTVTRGIVSALNRNIPVPKAGGGTTVLAGAIQTDAAINPGNSGGPLVTCAGHLVGVNTAISTVPNANGVAGGGSVGIGFAVPAATAGRIVDELQRNGRVRRHGRPLRAGGHRRGARGDRRPAARRRHHEPRRLPRHQRVARLAAREPAGRRQRRRRLYARGCGGRHDLGAGRTTLNLRGRGRDLSWRPHSRLGSAHEATEDRRGGDPRRGQRRHDATVGGAGTPRRHPGSRRADGGRR
jgi:S1-C subfamily serine protease